MLDNSKKLKEYIADVQKLGVNVLPPDINLSESDFTVSDGNIRFGLLAIKNVGRIFSNTVVATRNKGKFESFDNFVNRMPAHELNKRTVESLIKCGVFDSLGVNRNSLLSVYEGILDFELNLKHSNIAGQFDLFSLAANEIDAPVYDYPSLPEFSLKELMILEKESSGMYFSGHMVDNYSYHISKLGVDRISDIIGAYADDAAGIDERYRDRAEVKIAGIIASKKTKATKNGSTMAFITVEDRLGEIEVIVFAKQYALYSNELFADNAVAIIGNVSSEDDEDPKIILSRVEPLLLNTNAEEIEKEPDVASKYIYIRVPDQKDERIPLIYRISGLNRGHTQIVLFDDSTRKSLAMKNICVDSSEKVVNKLKEIFGDGNVVVK